jgi:poly(3-hydroxybutyrate) depolymerase
VTVSGISSGAFMAVQLGVAYSAQVHGVAAIAGGIYGCALGQTNLATDLCMKTPEKIDVNQYISLVSDLTQKNTIDNPSNLVQHPVFVLNGTEDKTVMPEAGKKLENFFAHYNAKISTEFTLKMGHAFPALKAKNKCEVSQFPWMNQCNYDGAQVILEKMYGSLNKASENLSAKILNFDQTEFDSKTAKMLDHGQVYIPASCSVKGAHCKLHIALHGCLQGPNIVQNAFYEGAGYNEWADANGIVILYPAATMGQGNPNGCWDWFGYTGANYAEKSALQMTAIMKMVERLHTEAN